MKHTHTLQREIDNSKRPDKDRTTCSNIHRELATAPACNTKRATGNYSHYSYYCDATTAVDIIPVTSSYVNESSCEGV